MNFCRKPGGEREYHISEKQLEELSSQTENRLVVHIWLLAYFHYHVVEMGTCQWDNGKFLKEFQQGMAYQLILLKSLPHCSAENERRWHETSWWQKNHSGSYQSKSNEMKDLNKSNGRGNKEKWVEESLTGEPTELGKACDKLRASPEFQVLHWRMGVPFIIG